MRIMLMFFLVGCIGCKAKNTQNIILTPNNNDLQEKMKTIGCECLYNNIKNTFLYNKNTGLYFGTINFPGEFADCYNQLSIGDFRGLYGPPHMEDDNYLYYYLNVMYCGQWFDGIKMKKDNDSDKIIGISSHVQEDIFPNKSKKFDVSCTKVDFIDKEKMRINQDFFKYFTEDFVDKTFKLADFINLQPKFNDVSFSEKCLDNIRFEQYNFLFNKNLEHYIMNHSSMSQAPPLVGYGHELNCQQSLNSHDLVIQAFGQPTYMTEVKDTLVYIGNNKLYKGRVPNGCWIWDEQYQTYFRKGYYDLDESYLPDTAGECHKP